MRRWGGVASHGRGRRGRGWNTCKIERLTCRGHHLLSESRARGESVYRLVVGAVVGEEVPHPSRGTEGAESWAAGRVEEGDAPHCD